MDRCESSSGRSDGIILDSRYLSKHAKAYFTEANEIYDVRN